MTQIATSIWGGTIKLSFAFTVHGILILLNTDQAIQTNIAIIRSFNKMRQFIFEMSDVKLDLEKIKKRLENQGQNIELLFGYLDEMSSGKPSDGRNRIGFK